MALCAGDCVGAFIRTTGIYNVNWLHLCCPFVVLSAKLGWFYTSHQHPAIHVHLVPWLRIRGDSTDKRGSGGHLSPVHTRYDPCCLPPTPVEHFTPLNIHAQICSEWRPGVNVEQFYMNRSWFCQQPRTNAHHQGVNVHRCFRCMAPGSGLSSGADQGFSPWRVVVGTFFSLKLKEM